MKVTSKPTGNGFSPITLTITLETKEEAVGFFMVHNHSHISDALIRAKAAYDDDAIRDEMFAAGFDRAWYESRWSEFEKAL